MCTKCGVMESWWGEDTTSGFRLRGKHGVQLVQAPHILWLVCGLCAKERIHENKLYLDFLKKSSKSNGKTSPEYIFSYERERSKALGTTQKIKRLCFYRVPEGR